LKRWLLGTHAGAVAPKHLQAYLDEFAFRHNRRRTKGVGRIAAPTSTPASLPASPRSSAADTGDWQTRKYHDANSIGRPRNILSHRLSLLQYVAQKRQARATAILLRCVRGDNQGEKPATIIPPPGRRFSS
jgi:hypothetical protein